METIKFSDFINGNYKEEDNSINVVSIAIIIATLVASVKLGLSMHMLDEFIW